MFFAVMWGIPYLVRTTFALIGFDAPASAGTNAIVPIAAIAIAIPQARILTVGRVDRNFAPCAGYLQAMSQPEAVEATREASFVLAEPEERILRWIAARLPRWVLPDDLTVLGVLAAFGVCGAYQLSNESDLWLWVASALLVVQWFGDSLDGTLARVRGIERPRYGYYLDRPSAASPSVTASWGQPRSASF